MPGQKPKNSNYCWPMLQSGTDRQKERFFIASAAIALLLIGGMLSIQYIRKRQKNKLVKIQA